MAYEDPNAPSQPQTRAPAAPAAAAPAVTPAKKSGSWDWLWPSVDFNAILTPVFHPILTPPVGV